MRLARIFRRRAQDEELARELEAHLQHETDEYLARGFNAEEAHRRARIRLGNEAKIREEVWRWNSWGLPETMLRDLWHAVRRLRRSPGFAITAIAVMAVGIGANAALFNVVHSVLLKPLPFPNPERLVMLYERSADAKFPFNVVAPGMFSQWQKQSGSFEEIAMWIGQL